MAEDMPPLQLEEFSSQAGNSTIYYQLLRLTGSVYVWVGTDRGLMAGLVAAAKPRVGSPVVSTLLGSSSANDQQTVEMTRRLQQRTDLFILLSLNLPSDDLLAHVEERLVEKLCFA